MDERVDQWATESPNRILIRCNIGPLGMVAGDGVHSGDFLEHFVPDEALFIFRGDEYQVQIIADEISLLSKKIQEFEAE